MFNKILRILLPLLLAISLAWCWKENNNSQNISIDYSSTTNYSRIEDLKLLWFKLWYIDKTENFVDIKKFFFWWIDKKTNKKYKTYNCIIVDLAFRDTKKTFCNKNWKIVLVSTWYSDSQEFNKIYSNVLSLFIQKKLNKTVEWETFNMFSWYNNIKLKTNFENIYPNIAWLPFAKYWFWTKSFETFWAKIEKIKKISWVKNPLWNWRYLFNELIHIDKYFYWWNNNKWKKLTKYDCIAIRYYNEFSDDLYKIYCKNWNNIRFIWVTWNSVENILDNYYNYLIKKKTEELAKK